MIAGKLIKIIAGELNVSMRTIEIHRADLMEKMHAKSLSALVAGDRVVIYGSDEELSMLHEDV